MKKIFINKLGLSGKKGLGGPSGGCSGGPGASSSICSQKGDVAGGSSHSGRFNLPQASASTSMAMAEGGGEGSSKIDLAGDESSRSGMSDVSIGSLPRKKQSSPSYILKSEYDSLRYGSPLPAERFSNTLGFECLRMLACLSLFDRPLTFVPYLSIVVHFSFF
jgi:hypothetical protein